MNHQSTILTSHTQACPQPSIFNYNSLETMATVSIDCGGDKYKFTISATDAYILVIKY